MVRKSFRQAWTITAGVTGLVFVLLSALAGAAVQDEIRERLQPVGEVCVTGEDCAAGVQVASAGPGEARDPMTVYQTYCFACHGTGANMAPVLGNAEQWAPRIEQGIEVLYQHAIEGFNNNAMPPMGLCVNCSQDEIRATVDYMVDAVQ